MALPRGSVQFIDILLCRTVSSQRSDTAELRELPAPFLRGFVGLQPPISLLQVPDELARLLKEVELFEQVLVEVADGGLVDLDDVPIGFSLRFVPAARCPHFFGDFADLLLVFVQHQFLLVQLWPFVLGHNASLRERSRDLLSFEFVAQPLNELDQVFSQLL